METLHNSFAVSYNYPVYFTEGLFSPKNKILQEILPEGSEACGKKILFVIDRILKDCHPILISEITNYFNNLQGIELCKKFLFIEGGEQVKNDQTNVEKVINAIEENGLCRHSFVVAVGGGAILDMVGYAATIAHRGIRHIRIPTTVLSQNDSGIGVKNGINAYGKKNFLGTFSPPYAVINDFNFLLTLEDRDWRSGISEAIKVALIKDSAFFNFIEEHAENLNRREMESMKILIHRCAELHMNHIAGGDPFEKGSSRPLDFGHWSAHKLEQITLHRLRHGEAVAIGMALDTTMSMLTGLLTENKWKLIISLIRQLGFDIYIPELETGLQDAKSQSIIKGLNEFREHLGGTLTIMMLKDIGKGVEVNQVDNETVIASVNLLRKYSQDIKTARVA